jgi:hypothetical protein
MTFAERLQAFVAPYAVATHQDRAREGQAADVVALHAPYLLRRFAEMAAVFDAPGLRSGQGAIFARRDDGGYTFVEYNAPALHITFDVIDDAAVLCWIVDGVIDRRRGADETPPSDFVDTRRITAETPTCVFDAMLMDAASAFVNTRPAILAAKNVSEMEAAHV